MTFVKDLVTQLRAGDTYGQLDRLSDEAMLRPFILTKASQREIPIDCDVDPATMERLRTYYQAVAAGIEKETGTYTTTVLDLNHEGFGWAMVFAGKLIVVQDVLRDAQRFGFSSVEALGEHGAHLVARGTEITTTYPEVARDDS